MGVGMEHGVAERHVEPVDRAAIGGELVGDRLPIKQVADLLRQVDRRRGHAGATARSTP